MKSGSVDKETVSRSAEATTQITRERDLYMTLLNVFVHFVNAAGEVAISTPGTCSVLDDF